MEYSAIVVPTVYQGDKVFTSLGAHVGVKLNVEVAHIGVESNVGLLVGFELDGVEQALVLGGGGGGSGGERAAGFASGLDAGDGAAGVGLWDLFSSC